MLAQGTFAPDCQLDGLEGETWSLHNALGKSPVLLVFFKISCPVCQFTFPFLQRLADGAQSGAPQIVAVSQDDAAGTAQFRKRFHLSLPAVLDKAWSFVVSSAFGISQVPSLFLVEPDGRISLASEGFSRADMEKLGARFGVVPFQAHEQIPALRPG